MKRILFLLFILALIPVAHADITVGVDYESLQEAIEHADNGDTIRVPAGVFPGGVTVDKRVSIVGAGIDSVLLSDGSMGTISVTADNVIIDGLTFAPSYSGVSVSGSGVSVKNCFFIENMIGVDVVGEGVYVTGCDFAGCGYTGIRAEGVDAARVGGNNFNNCRSSLLLSLSNSSGVVDNTLHASDAGMVLESVYNSTFSGNQFYGCNTSISLVESGWNTFSDNLVEGGVFLKVANCVENLAKENIVDGVYVVQRYSSGNRYQFNGLSVTGDLFSASVIESDVSEYTLISDVLSFEMQPDPVYGGASVTVDVDIGGEVAEVAIPGTLSLYDLDSMDMLVSLSQNGSRLTTSFTLEDDVSIGCLMQVDTEPPSAVINAPSEGLVGDVFYFDAGDSTDNKGIVEFDWSMGDGQTGNDIITQHYYSAPGEYQVTLRVADASGNMDTATNNITITEETPEEPIDTSNQTIWIALFIALIVSGVFLYSRYREQLN